MKLFAMAGGGQEKKKFFSAVTKLPSRWIQVRSAQVQGGDVMLRMRTGAPRGSKPYLEQNNSSQVTSKQDPQNYGMFPLKWKPAL